MFSIWESQIEQILIKFLNSKNVVLHPTIRAYYEIGFVCLKCPSIKKKLQNL